jgi:ribonuclease R
VNERVVVELRRRGKLVVGEPLFHPGVPLLVDRKGLGDADNGEIAVLRRGRGRARLERVIGRADNVEHVLEGLLVEEGLREGFEPYDAPAPSLDERVDLRDLVTFTVDPETAKDFDDALSFRREEDGVRAWVHIADVAHFVPAGSPLDHGAAGRSFSTYVPGLVAPMLPPELADEFPPEGQPSFYRSVIRSDARLTYPQAHAREAEPHVVESLDLGWAYAERLRTARFERGALQIESGEIAFEFDGEGSVARAWRESEPEAHALVEELMILANEAVASLLAGRRREALYRVHERPDPQAISLLIAKLADLEVPTPPEPETLSPAGAATLAGAISERTTEYVRSSGRGLEAFPTLILRSLKQARYDPRNLGHSGLASTAYCHFTSPIRRYPDLVCHRALLSELGASAESLPEELDDLAEHTSAREREAAKSEYLADEICLAWFLDDQLFELGWQHEFDGEIIGLIGSGLFVRFGEVFEGYVPARRLPGDYFELNSLATALVGRRGGGRYRLGDPLQVRVEKIERFDGKVELAPA